MSLAFIKWWYSRIPPVERNLPVLLHRGRVYSPNEIYYEVMKGTKIGEELQMKLEAIRAEHSFSLEDLKGLDYIARKRVEEIIKNLPDDFSMVAIVNGERRVIGKSEFINSPLFNKAVEEEKRKIVKVLRG